MSASTPTDGKRRSGSRCSGRWVSAPSLISWGPGRLDGFALGLSDHRVHHKWGAQQPDGQIQWSPFGTAWDPPIGNPLDPQVLTLTSWGPGRLDLFARGGAGDVVHMFYDAHAPNTHGGWGPLRAGQVNWETLGGQILGSPVAVLRRRRRRGCRADARRAGPATCALPDHLLDPGVPRSWATKGIATPRAQAAAAANQARRVPLEPVADLA